MSVDLWHTLDPVSGWSYYTRYTIMYCVTILSTLFILVSPALDTLLSYPGCQVDSRHFTPVSRIAITSVCFVAHYTPKGNGAGSHIIKFSKYILDPYVRHKYPRVRPILPGRVTVHP